MKSNPCRLCGSKWHTKMACPQNKDRKRLRTSSKDRRLKNKFIHVKPPNHEGYVRCIIGQMMIPIKEATVGHDIPKSRAPELAYDYDNMDWECSYHNLTQGSKTWAEYLATSKAAWRPCRSIYA